MGVWSDDLQRKLKAKQMEVNNKCYAIAKELFNLVIDKSPSKEINSKWAKGVLKNNWLVNEGSAFKDGYPRAGDQSGSGAKQEVASLSGLAFYGKNGTITFSNNLPYAYRAEKLGWPVEDNPLWKNNIGPYAMVSTSLTIVAAKHR